MPPRCRWPSTSERVSLPVRFSISRATLSATPPRRASRPASGFSMSVISPPTGIAPSAQTTIEKCRPAASRAMIFSQTFSMRYGISGIRITSAEPAMPAESAIQPQ